MLTAGPTEQQASSLPPRRRWPTVLGSVVFVTAATLMQLPRQSGVEMWRTVWAEDGALFYEDALARPLREVIFEPYAGYAHVGPRILASIGVHLPTESYSYFVVLTSALIAALLGLFVYFASAPLLRSQVRQGVLTGALLMWPVLPFEIAGVITNIQWVMPVACLLAVLLPVERPAAIAVRVPIVLLAPLTSPLCVLFVPIAVWRVVRRFTRQTAAVRLVVPLTYLIAAAGQLFIWRTAPQTAFARPSVGSFGVDVAKLYSTKVSTEFFFGVRVTEDLWERVGYWAAAGTTVVIGGVLLWRFWRSSAPSRWVIGLCVAASLVIFAASIWQRAEFMASMVVANSGPYTFLGMRYQLFPAALLLLALLVRRDLGRDAIDEPVRLTPRRLGDDVRHERLVLLLAGVWFLVAFVPSYRLHTARSSGPDWTAGVSAAEQACRLDPSGAPLVPISPAPDWVVTVPCPQLD